MTPARPRLIERLRERGVLRVAISYVVIAWLVLQIADVVLAPWDLPAWVLRAPLVIAALGFPIALALAWFLELGDGGIARDTADAGVARPATHGLRRYADVAIISVLGAIVLFFVLRDAGWLGDALRPGSSADSSSIAVLPFVNLGSDAERHVSEGLSDELRNQFSRIRSLTVTARSSSVAFEGQRLDAVTIAGKLAVASLLEGTVGRSAGRLQVSVQLINGRDGTVLWAERFARPDTDLLAVQSEIASAVVAAVLPRFAASGKAAPPPPTEDPVAYDLYLLGRQKLGDADLANWSADESGLTASTAQAVELFRSAIAADPGFARAHAGLARGLLMKGLMEIDEATPEAQAAALDRMVMPAIERALELDPKGAEAWYVKGTLLRSTHRPGDHAAFRRAIELDPSHARATLALAWTAIADGRPDERHRLLMRARELDPMDMGIHSTAMLSAWILGRRDDAHSIAARAVALFPDNRFAAQFPCQAWSSFGQPDEGLACNIEVTQRLAGPTGAPARCELPVAALLYELGHGADALPLYERARLDTQDHELRVALLRGDGAGLAQRAREALARRPRWDVAFLAQALVRNGQTGLAVELFEHSGVEAIMGGDSRFKPFVLHATLEYAALLKQQGRDEEAARLLQPAAAWVDSMLRHGGRVIGLWLGRASIDAIEGRPDAALEALAAAIDAHDSPMTPYEFESSPVFRDLRKDPRFTQQLRRYEAKQRLVYERIPQTFSRHGLAWPPACAN